MKPIVSIEELEKLENQLRCPQGEDGIVIAQQMNTSNMGMTKTTIKALRLEVNNTVLEIGHGNCGHLSVLLSNAKNLQYTGLEISETMQQEARSLNKELLKRHPIDFLIYNGVEFPFKEECFDRIMSVNTVYFWEDPLLFLTEIYRVLKPGGLFVLTFAQKEFMKTLPFVRDKFRTYDCDDLKEILVDTDFIFVSATDTTDTVKSKSGSMVARTYTVMSLCRS